MAEAHYQQMPWSVSSAKAQQASTATSVRLSSTQENLTSFKPPLRRQSLSPSKPPYLASDKLKASSGRRSASDSAPSGGRDGLPRGALGTMNDEITYTPTTHRISKAKKGKKVHACEHPGCTKIFTRAEHRKRHEANHNVEPLYQCRVEDCRKPFQRSDLLARHMERQHNVPAEPPLTRGSRSQRSTSEPSIVNSTPPRSSMISAPVGPPQLAGGLALSNTAGTMSIGSIIEPSMPTDFMPPLNDLASMAVGVGPAGMPRDLVYGLPMSAESPLYSSEDCYSPMSDHLQPHVNGPRYMHPEGTSRSQSTPVESFYHPQLLASPLPAASAFPVWDHFNTGIFGPSMEGQLIPSVRFPSSPMSGAQTSQNRPYQYPSPAWVDSDGGPYEMDLRQPWHTTRVTL